MNAKFAIEHFHLVFLSFLDRKLDKRLYALKGGCNLRFYFQSIRYSEDIDQAIENTMSISFSDFSGQVLTYLEPELSVHYNKQKWQSTQDFLVKKLEELK